MISDGCWAVCTRITGWKSHQCPSHRQSWCDTRSSLTTGTPLALVTACYTSGSATATGHRASSRPQRLSPSHLFACVKGNIQATQTRATSVPAAHMKVARVFSAEFHSGIAVAQAWSSVVVEALSC
jgi:hypothetical protein